MTSRGKYSVSGPDSRGKYAIIYFPSNSLTPRVVAKFSDEFTAYRHKRALVKFTIS